MRLFFGKLFIIVIIIISISAVVWAGIASASSSKFLEVTLMDIVRLVVTAALGSYVASLYSSSLNQKNRRFSLVSAELVALRGVFEDASLICKAYMERPREEEYKRVNLKLKRAGTKLSYFTKIVIKCDLGVQKKHCSQLVESLNKIRDVVTGGDFASGRPYTNEIIDDAAKRFSALHDQLDRLLMELV